MRDQLEDLFEAKSICITVLEEKPNIDIKKLGYIIELIGYLESEMEETE